MDEYVEVRQKIITAVMENIPDAVDEIERAKIAEKIADVAMDAVAENYRSISEICNITEAVKVGMKVGIDYADPSEMDDDNPYVCRRCY